MATRDKYVNVGVPLLNLTIDIDACEPRDDGLYHHIRRAPQFVKGRPSCSVLGGVVALRSEKDRGVFKHRCGTFARAASRSQPAYLVFQNSFRRDGKILAGSLTLTPDPQQFRALYLIIESLLGCDPDLRRNLVSRETKDALSFLLLQHHFLSLKSILCASRSMATSCPEISVAT